MVASVMMALAATLVAASGMADGKSPFMPLGTPDGTVVVVEGIEGKAVVSPDSGDFVRVTAMLPGGAGAFKELLLRFRDRFGAPDLVRPDPPLVGWSSADVTVTFLPRRPDAVWIDWGCPAR